jgi:putative spermidine/putrescine transport system substrate-binding protein
MTGQLAAYWAALQATGGLLAGCAPQPTPEEEMPTDAPVAATADELVVVSWGGAYQDAQRKAFFDPFEEEYGVTILDSGDMDFAKILAMAEAGAMEWDVGDVGTMSVYRGAQHGVLEPIDYSRFENTDDLIQEGMHEFGVVTIFYSDVIGYNTESYPTGSHPQSFVDFWDVENFPGRKGLYNYVTPQVEFALLADGLPMDELYPLNDEKIERAFTSLDRIKEHINVWWDSGAQPAQLLADGELDMCTGWNGRFWTVQQEGAPVAVEWNQGALESDSWLIPKGAPHLELAQEFVAFASRADRQAEFTEYIPYGPINTKAFDFIPEEMAPHLPTSPQNRDKQFIFDSEWWGENADPLIERFENWKLT